MKTLNITVRNIATVTGFTQKEVTKQLRKLKIVVPVNDAGNGKARTGFVNLLQASRICRDINPAEITVRYARQELIALVIPPHIQYAMFQDAA